MAFPVAVILKILVSAAEKSALVCQEPFIGKQSINKGSARPV
jgi:hypothetical protein